MFFFFLYIGNITFSFYMLKYRIFLRFSYFLHIYLRISSSLNSRTRPSLYSYLSIPSIHFSHLSNRITYTSIFPINQFTYRTKWAYNHHLKYYLTLVPLAIPFSMHVPQPIPFSIPVPKCVVSNALRIKSKDRLKFHPQLHLANVLLIELSRGMKSEKRRREAGGGEGREEGGEWRGKGLTLHAPSSLILNQRKCSFIEQQVDVINENDLFVKRRWHC